jgi:hypothetical protein
LVLELPWGCVETTVRQLGGCRVGVGEGSELLLLLQLLLGGGCQLGSSWLLLGNRWRPSLRLWCSEPRLLLRVRQLGSNVLLLLLYGSRRVLGSVLLQGRRLLWRDVGLTHRWSRNRLVLVWETT